jgi:hypothetical protein
MPRQGPRRISVIGIGIPPPLTPRTAPARHGDPPHLGRQACVTLITIDDRVRAAPNAGWALRVRSEHRRGLLSADRARELELVPDWGWSG